MSERIQPLVCAAAQLSRIYLNEELRFQVQDSYNHHYDTRGMVRGGYLTTRQNNFRPCEVATDEGGHETIDSILESVSERLLEVPIPVPDHGIALLPPCDQETVYVHSNDLGIWSKIYQWKGLLQPDFNMNLALIYAHIHDLGEAVTKDHPVGNGPKTTQQRLAEEQGYYATLDRAVNEGHLDSVYARELQDHYKDYNLLSTQEAHVIHVLDRFCGGLVHLHHEMHTDTTQVEQSLMRLDAVFNGTNEQDGYRQFMAKNYPEYTVDLFWQDVLEQYKRNDHWVRFALDSEI
jgi:5'-deoxynucleotidase YfbR-like HD superfamily hydrolase